MVKHRFGFPITFGAAYLGVSLYLIIGSIFEWITPIWLGGKAIFIVIADSIYVPLSALIFYIITIKSLKAKNYRNEFFYRHLIVAGILLGFLFNPCIFLTSYLIQIIPGWKELNLLMAVHMSLAITSLLCAIIVFLLFCLFFLRKKMHEQKC